MCDYSRRFPCSRMARIGDKLITTRIGPTCGFVLIGDRRVGVCLKPGTELAFDKPVEIANLLGRWFSRWLNQDKQRSVALFRQKTRQGHRHDLLEFPDGHVERLAWLYEEQIATVLQLPAIRSTGKKLRHQNNRSNNGLRPNLSVALGTVTNAQRSPSGSTAASCGIDRKLRQHKGAFGCEVHSRKT